MYSKFSSIDRKVPGSDVANNFLADLINALDRWLVSTKLYHSVFLILPDISGLLTVSFHHHNIKS